MTVAELIELLRQYPPTSPVRAWDADADDYVEVTGAIYEAGCPDVDLTLEGDVIEPMIELQTDEDP